MPAVITVFRQRFGRMTRKGERRFRLRLPMHVPFGRQCSILTTCVILDASKPCICVSDGWTCARRMRKKHKLQCARDDISGTRVCSHVRRLPNRCTDADLHMDYPVVAHRRAACCLAGILRQGFSGWPSPSCIRPHVRWHRIVHGLRSFGVGYNTLDKVILFRVRGASSRGLVVRQEPSQQVLQPQAV